MNAPKRKPAVKVAVSDHAREQARARFPGFKAARIIDDVREALCEGRCSSVPPPWFPSTADSLFVWTPDGLRVYALRSKNDCLLVTTAMRGEAAA